MAQGRGDLAARLGGADSPVVTRPLKWTSKANSLRTYSQITQSHHQNNSFLEESGTTSRDDVQNQHCPPAALPSDGLGCHHCEQTSCRARRYDDFVQHGEHSFTHRHCALHALRLRMHISNALCRLHFLRSFRAPHSFRSKAERILFVGSRLPSISSNQVTTRVSLFTKPRGSMSEPTSCCS